MVLAETLEALPGAEDGLASQRGRVATTGKLDFEGPEIKLLQW